MKVFALIIIALMPCCAHGLPEQEVDRWIEDIDVYAQNIVRHHIDPFHSITKREFDREIQRIKNELPGSGANEILVGLMQLTHRISDGHTSLPLWSRELNSFPLELKIFDDDLYVVKTINEHEALLGSRLLSINGIGSREIIRRFSTLTPFSENEYSTAVRVAEYIPKAEILNGLGIIHDTSRASFSFDVNGKSEEHNLASDRAYHLEEQISYRDNSQFSVVEKVGSGTWFGSSSDKSTIYFNFRRYTSISKMESLAKDLLAYINSHQSRYLIIDLRDNYGGDFFVGLKLAQLLILAESIDWKSGVYVLINNVTFSAAMSNAAQFSQILNAELVGEPTGAKPSGYQDMGQFVLPNSKLEVTYSKRLFHFKEGDKDALYPDINIELSVSDYIDTNDSQLIWVLNDIAIKQSAYDRALQGTSR